jgi:hypothetical protein
MPDPITVAGLVAALIGAFTNCYNIYKDIRKRLKAKAAEQHAVMLQQFKKSLRAAPSLIQGEYNTGSESLGGRFAEGDGK